MQTKFYVSHEKEQMGPYSVDEIVKFVGDGTLSPLDYIYDEAKADWILFLDHELLAEKVKAMKPKAPPRAQEEEPEKLKSKKIVHENKSNMPAELVEPMSHEWFVLKGENKFGPFSYVDLIKMLQQGVVFEFDFAWHDGMANWERLAEISAFQKENLKKLKDTAMPEISEVFFRRRYRRVNYGGTILVHDNKKVWKGIGVEISEGGAGVVMENAMVLPGQELYLHFKPGDGVPPFNAVCEVVSKQFTTDVANPSSPIKYGLKFKTLSTDAQKLIKEYAKKSA